MDEDKNEDELVDTEAEELEIDLDDTVAEGEYTPPTKEEYEELKKQILTIKAQKEHFKKKANKKETVSTPHEDSFTREEAVLIAQGMDLEDLDNLKAIQKGLGLSSFKDAVDSSLFKAYRNEKQTEKKRKESSLGASGGSGDSTESKFRPGMSAEEHEKAWRESRK